MTERRVTVEITDGVADVRLARPEKRNALDGAMFAGLIAAGERLKSEPGVRAVVLSGEGPDFCAGLDFGSFAAMRDGERLSALVDLPPGAGQARATGQRAAYVWTEIPAALELAGIVAGRNPDAIRAAKRLLDLAGRVDLETGFAAEQQEIGALIGSPNQAEAVAAEFGQRPPRFTDPG